MGSVGALFLLIYVVYIAVSLFIVLKRASPRKRLLASTIILSSGCFAASIILINYFRGFVEFQGMERSVLGGLTAAIGWFGLLAPAVVAGLVLFRRETRAEKTH